MITYKDYQRYFLINDKVLSTSMDIISQLDLPRISIDDFPDNIGQITIEVFKSGYRAMAFDDIHMISQVSDQERAYILLYALAGLRYLYQKNNYSQKVFYATLSDLSLRINLYYREHQVVGLTPDDGHWLIRIYFLNIFKIGCLQFERLTLDFSALPFELTWLNQDWERKLQGSQVLSVHIMSGSNISREASSKALSCARIFFANEDVCYFYCLSWLLNPNNKYLLTHPSKILSFADLFDLKAWSSFADWMIFSVFQGDLKKPAQTSLQAKAQAQEDKLGLGLGIIPFKEKGDNYE